MRSRRRAFTLVELLVVIAILLGLTLLVVAVFSANAGGERMRSGARTAQSAFLGARDRALHAKSQRGIRLIRDPNDSTLVTGFAYIQPMQLLSYPLQSVQLERPDFDGDGTIDSTDVLIVRGFVSPVAAPWTDWDQLSAFFATPPRIRIPAVTGRWYTFQVNTAPPYNLTATNQVLQLTSPFIDPGAPPPVILAHDRSSVNSSCEIELGPELLPNHAPISLPSGVVIDLDFSSANVTATWPGTSQINLMFSQRGMVAGKLAALGPIHFLLNDVQDATQGLNPIAAANKGEKLILTIFPQTGNVATFPIDPTDADANGVADDLFRFAKLGSTAAN